MKIVLDGAVEIKTLSEIENYLLNERHGEYVYVMYYDGDKLINKYTVRCWYNDKDCVWRNGQYCYDWKQSQKNNAKEIYDYLLEDGVLE